MATNKKSIDYQDYLIESLKDPEEATSYLNAALMDGVFPCFFWRCKMLYRRKEALRCLLKKPKRAELVYIKLYLKMVILI